MGSETKAKSGKGPARQLRTRGLIPAIYYGPGIDPVKLTVSPAELSKALSSDYARNQLIELSMGDEKKMALVKDLEVEPVPGEPRVPSDPDREEEVAVRSSVATGKAAAPDPQGRAVLDPHGDPDIDLLGLAGGLAESESLRTAEGGGREPDLEVVLEVPSLDGSRIRTASTPESTESGEPTAPSRPSTEGVAEDRLEVVGRDVLPGAGPGRSARRSACRTVDPRVSVPVVVATLLGIREDVVGLLHLVEALGGVVALVEIRVVLPRELPVRRPDLVVGRGSGEPEDLVVVAGVGHPPSIRVPPPGAASAARA